MESMTLTEIVDTLGARPTGSLGIIGSHITSVCTDTRQGAEGSLFFALRGENTDGHAYAAHAFSRGAVAAVVEREGEGVAGLQLVVVNALKALGDLARRYRERFAIPVIGITGSVGKTSTKEMVAFALRSRLHILANEKNFNNEIGVPLTLFNLDSTHHAAVIEMGMRGEGQIAYLCAISRPTIGLITNVGLSHVELLGSREGIANAKSDLLKSLPADGVAILPADDEFAGILRDRADGRHIRTFGVRNEADFRATDIEFDSNGGSQFCVNGVRFAIYAPGVHHVINACAACATAAELGIPLAEVAKQLARFRAPNMRMEAVELGHSITLLNDAYNAAPDSMRAALETLAMVANGRRTVAILGDMRELGDWSEEAHRFVGTTAAECGIELIMTVGKASRWTAVSAAVHSGSTVISFPDTTMAADETGQLLQPGDVVLVKGSRAMAMERIVDALIGRFTRV